MKCLGINLTQEVKDLYNKNMNHWKNKSKISEDGKISHANGLAESMM
jgi:hypothetical protein